METPKPPASSELRRPSTRPYARRKRAATVRDTDVGDVNSEAPSEATNEASGQAPGGDLAVARAAAPSKAKSKTVKPRSRAKTQPATPVAIAAAATSPHDEDTLDLTLDLDAVDLEAAVASLTDVTLAATLDARGDVRGDDAVPRALDAHAHAQIDASLDVIETLMVDLLDITRPIAAPMQQMLIAQQNADLSFAELPSPRQLPSGAPTDAAPPPGLVPRGDSRSLRRGALFALIYRSHCFVVTRHGKVGQQGHWSAVEYPTPAAASHAYARGCSHWVSEGFSDYRG